MDLHLLLDMLAILALVAANGFFALSEFSIIAGRKSKLRQMVQLKLPGAAAAEKLNQNREQFLATVQVGITLFGTIAGVIGGATLVTKLEEVLSAINIEFIAGASSVLAVVIVALTITVVSVILGELVPKYLALSNPELYARHVARPISVFTKMTSLFARLLSGTAGLIIRMLGVKSDPASSAASEDEINLMILEGRQKGVFDQTEQELIRSVFDFADSTVRRSITPRTDLVAFDINASADEILKTITESGFSRYPVYDKTIDNVVGLLYIKDLIYRKGSLESLVLKDIIHKPVFVPDSMPLAKLLRKMQRTKNQLAIVLDEFGGTAGIITLEDIIEELVGQIQDEYDTETTELVRHSETVAFVEGDVWPGEINDLMDCHLPEDKAHTIAGLVIDELGRIPQEEESVTIEDMNITILERENNRLVRLKLEKIGSSQTDQHEQEN